MWNPADGKDQWMRSMLFGNLNAQSQIEASMRQAEAARLNFERRIQSDRLNADAAAADQRARFNRQLDIARNAQGIDTLTLCETCGKFHSGPMCEKVALPKPA